MGKKVANEIPNKLPSFFTSYTNTKLGEDNGNNERICGERNRKVKT